MPLSKKGKKILRNMRKHYGNESGTRVFYASYNKGIITGVKIGRPRKRKPKDE